jgi:hypothetical protein
MATARKKPATAAAPADEMPSLDGLRKLVEKFNVPGIDIDALVDWQRKDLEALIEAKRQACEGVKALAARRNEILHETLAHWQSALKSTAGKEEFAKQS